GWQILDPLDQIKQIVEAVRRDVDLIIVLSHLGYKADIEMANQLNGIDVIIGAHSHHLLESGIKENGTFIIQAGKFGQYIGQTTIEMDVNTKQVTSVTGTCHDV